MKPHTHNNAAPIALFDSGVGGIGVLREVKKLLPSEQLTFFGDAANAPYGERPTADIRRLVLEHAARLLQDCKALVLACNTATAVAANELRALYPDTPIIGMEPALRPAALIKAHPVILALATAATLRLEKFGHLQKIHAKNATVIKIPAPNIVRLVEAGLADSPEMDAYLDGLLAPFKQDPPDAVVLGCTHFPFAAASIRRVFGHNIPLFDGAKGTARELAHRLAADGLLAPKDAVGGVTITASDPRSLPLFTSLYFQS
ncbi:MAG: glutamate racemase [Clostridia bacterium]|nr:glutamate racemase [Clostridia bacterium]